MILVDRRNKRTAIIELTHWLDEGDNRANGYQALYNGKCFVTKLTDRVQGKQFRITGTNNILQLAAFCKTLMDCLEEVLKDTPDGSELSIVCVWPKKKISVPYFTYFLTSLVNAALHKEAYIATLKHQLFDLRSKMLKMLKVEFNVICGSTHMQYNTKIALSYKEKMQEMQAHITADIVDSNKIDMLINP